MGLCDDMEGVKVDKSSKEARRVFKVGDIRIQQG